MAKSSHALLHKDCAAPNNERKTFNFSPLLLSPPVSEEQRTAPSTVVAAGGDRAQQYTPSGVTRRQVPGDLSTTQPAQQAPLV
jgi:hypothetical protein